MINKHVYPNALIEHKDQNVIVSPIDLDERQHTHLYDYRMVPEATMANVEGAVFISM